MEQSKSATWWHIWVTANNIPWAKVGRCQAAGTGGPTSVHAVWEPLLDKYKKQLTTV